MKTNVYLHSDIVQVLRMIDSDLNIAVNKVLNAMYLANKSFTDYPECRSRDETCKRYNITLTCKEYENTLLMYPANSPRASLRRLLYWFIENEMYEEVNISFSNLNNATQLVTLSKYFLDADDYMIKALTYANKHNFSDIFIRSIVKCRTEIASALKEISDEQKRNS